MCISALISCQKGIPKLLLLYQNKTKVIIYKCTVVSLCSLWHDKHVTFISVWISVLFTSKLCKTEMYLTCYELKIMTQ